MKNNRVNSDRKKYNSEVKNNKGKYVGATAQSKFNK